MLFVLTIHLGNDAMTTGGDVAAALRKLAFRIDHPTALVPGAVAPIHDANGNRVGGCHVQSEPLTPRR